MRVSNTIKFQYNQLLKLGPILFFVLSYQYCTAQYSDSTFVNRFSQQELQHDFNALTETLNEYHPSINRFISPDSLNQLKTYFLQSITDSLSELEFHAIIRKYVKQIRCGHTVTRPTENWYIQQRKSPQTIPLNVFLIKDKAFVKEVMVQDSVLSSGLEITSINSKPMPEVLKAMKSIQELDGYSSTYENKKIERLFRTYLLFLYGRQDSFYLEYKSASGEIKDHILYSKSMAKKKTQSTAKMTQPIFSMSGAKLFRDSLDSHLVVLDINSFDFKGYKRFYKRCFKYLKQEHIQYFVVDLRNNGGGYLPNGNNLLRYLLPEGHDMNFSRPNRKHKRNSNLRLGFFSGLTKNLFELMPDKNKADTNRNYQLTYKPKHKLLYQEKLYVLTNGGTFSMASFAACRLKHDISASVIGSETGGGEFGSNAVLVYKLTLPNSKIRVNIPYYFLDHGITSNIPGSGIIPTFNAEYSLQDKVNNQDLEMEILRSLIK